MVQISKWGRQLDTTTSHTARATQAWCENNCPAWISKEEWPPFSPDLKALKLKLKKTWEKIPMEIVCASINDFSRRLRAVVKAKGKHFE